MSGQSITRIEGRALPLRGHDIDTDRIIPARFLRSVRFEGLEAHLFEDERASWSGKRPHPVDDPAYAGANIMVVNRNFGCGSSREHAPQAMYRWGIRAVVGESFSEIFFGNALMLGLPCLTASPADLEFLQGTVEADPSTPVTVDMAGLVVEAAGRRLPVGIPKAAQEALITGQWDATGMLLDHFEEVEAVARSLPYIRGFSSSGSSA